MNILFVCTANQCRSPLAHVIAAARLSGTSHVVASAGFLPGGREAADGAQRAAKRLGLDLSQHVSRTLDAQIINSADAILTMEPDHVLDLVELVPESRQFALTLKEAARHAAAANSEPLRSERAISSWVNYVADRGLDSLMSPDNTVADPMGRSNRAFRATAKELDGLIGTVLNHWFG